MSGRSGSGPLGPSAHTDWLGQPSHASALPASSEEGPYTVSDCSELAHKTYGTVLWCVLRDLLFCGTALDSSIC